MKKIILLLLLAPIIALANGETVSPNMQLVVPAVGITTGPQWAADLDISLGIIDAHDHSPGRGVQVTPAGLNINSALSCQGNRVTNLGAAQFTAQGSTPANDSVYVNGVDLYYVDGNGNAVRLTQSGSVAGAAGSISGLTAPASASYVSASSTFVWQSDTNTSASLDAGCLLQRDLTASSNAVTLCAPNALAANYSLTWPAALPPSQKFATIDGSGNISAPWAVDNSSLEVSGNTVQVKAGGITQAMLSARSTGTTVGVNGVAISASSGTFTTSATSMTSVTNLTVTITTTGKPVFLGLQNDGNGTNSALFQSVNDSLSFYQVARTGTSSAILAFNRVQDISSVYPGGGPGFLAVDVVAAGTYTYTFQVATTAGGSATWRVFFQQLVAYEL